MPSRCHNEMQSSVLKAMWISKKFFPIFGLSPIDAIKWSLSQSRPWKHSKCGHTFGLIRSVWSFWSSSSSRSTWSTRPIRRPIISCGIMRNRVWWRIIVRNCTWTTTMSSYRRLMQNVIVWSMTRSSNKSSDCSRWSIWRNCSMSPSRWPGTAAGKFEKSESWPITSEEIRGWTTR